MKARPILMSAPMVRALLDGRKTQTRRAIRLKTGDTFDEKALVAAIQEWRPVYDKVAGRVVGKKAALIRCPYGKPGDLLWVRETWQLHTRATDLAKVVYRASEATSHTEFHELVPVSLIGDMQPRPFQQGWRSSIHMPRWASRLTLELTEMRVQQLQEISDADAQAEGCFFTDYGRRCFHQGQGNVTTCPAADEHHPQREAWMWDRTTSSDQCLGSPRAAYGNLWESINGPGSWTANPWVWVLTFRVHQRNVDLLLRGTA